MIAYSASKSGLHGLTLWLSTYWAGKNIRVNTVFPGGVESNQPRIFQERYIDRVPLGRMAKQNDIIGVYIYLISDASKYVTGQKFFVDGGLSAW